MVKLVLNERELQAKQGVMIVLSYLALFVTNFSVIYVANYFFPHSVVLGTFALTPLWALALTTTKLTIIDLLVMLLVPYKEWKTKKDLTPAHWMGLYLVVNILSVYAISRFAEIYGFGVSGIWTVLFLSIFMDLVQGMVMMQLGKVKIK